MAIYLTIDKATDAKGGYIAVISDGSPQRGDIHVTVLSVERCRNPKAAKRWYRDQMQTRPWETRQ